MVAGSRDRTRLVSTIRSGVIVVLVAIMAAGCGSTSSAGRDSAEGVIGFARDLLGRHGVSEAAMGAIASAGCGAYIDGLGREDAFLFRDYIKDLLGAHGPGSMDRIDQVVVDACRTFERGGDV